MSTETQEAPPSATPASAHVTAEGRFGPNGRGATLDVEIPADARLRITARVLTDECRGQTSTLFQTSVSDDPPLAIIDLDGDGRDEIFLLDRGNTIQNAVLLRVDGCRVARVWAENEPSNDGDLPFHVSGYPGGGTGILCRVTASGSVEVLQIQHGPGGSLDMTDPEHPAWVVHDHVGWIRTTFVLRGDRLVKTREETGRSRSVEDPSVPLLNHFECLGAARQ